MGPLALTQVSDGEGRGWRSEIQKDFSKVAERFTDEFSGFDNLVGILIGSVYGSDLLISAFWVCVELKRMS